MEKCWCGNSDLQIYSESYSKCTKCGTLVSKNSFSDDIYQVSDEESDLYGKNYWLKTMVSEAGVQKASDLINLYLNGRAVYWLEKSLKYFRLGGRVAEVGCGLGQFSYLLKQSGFITTAYELSEEICEYIRKTFNVSTVRGELTESDQPYDTIVAMDVFEHLTDPQAFLEVVKETLLPEGVLCLQLPCYDPLLDYDLMIKQKLNFQKLLVPDQHVYLYSKESIQNLLQRAGFIHVTFEHAFFGDDYDMFLFASRRKINLNDEIGIKQYLFQQASGQLIKSHIGLFNDKELLQEEIVHIQKDRDKQLADLIVLNKMVKEKQRENDELKIACEERLQDINKLTEELKEKEKRIQIIQKSNEMTAADMQYKNKIIGNLEVTCEERLQVIKSLSVSQEDKDEQIQLYSQAAEERLLEIQKLNTLLESANNRIMEGESQVDIFKEAAQNRLLEIEKLNELLKNANVLIFEKDRELENYRTNS